MPDLSFRVDGVEPKRFAAEPTLLFKLHVLEEVGADSQPTLVHSIVLSCQLRIEPSRRKYTDGEKERLLDLFGTPERWGQTLRPFLWRHVTTAVPPFTGEGVADLPVPCSYDFSLAATKYFDALGGGELPLCFLFSGSMFYESEQDGMHVAQIPWEKEANYRLPAETWKQLMDAYYPNGAWLHLRKDVFDSLARFKSREGLATLEQALESLLAARQEARLP
jgi:Family of unknown function (DUF6084)